MMNTIKTILLKAVAPILALVPPERVVAYLLRQLLAYITPQRIASIQQTLTHIRESLDLAIDTLNAAIASPAASDELVLRRKLLDAWAAGEPAKDIQRSIANLWEHTSYTES